MTENKYGLKRYIPEAIAREVRERCGFGCVVCGGMVCYYEHFNPSFEDCGLHKADGITLLCNSCHDKKTRQFLPISRVIEANSNPFATRDGFWNELYYDSTPISIALGSNRFNYWKDIIVVNDKKILSIDPPETQKLSLSINRLNF